MRITPYDATRIGHTATYLAFDVVRRVWLDAGHEVPAPVDLTDIDDPLLERAAQDGVDWRELADAEIQLFRDDMAALRVLPQGDYVGAVEAMDEIAAGVQRLVESGAGYRCPTPITPTCTSTSRARPSSATSRGSTRRRCWRCPAERGGDPDRPGKRQPLDPLLWRMARPGSRPWDWAR